MKGWSWLHAAFGVVLLAAGLLSSAFLVVMGLMWLNRSLDEVTAGVTPLVNANGLYLALATGFAAILGAAALSVHHDEGEVTWNGMMARADDVAIATLLLFLGINVVHSVLPRMLKRA